MTVFLLSLGGFLPMAGFIGKWYIFSAAVERRPLLARHHRRADERRLGLLLPPHRRHDVHDRRQSTSCGHVCRSPPPPGSPWPTPAVFYLGILPTKVNRARARFDFDDLLGSRQEPTDQACEKRS